MNLLYSITRKWFLKHYYKEQSRPVTHRDLNPVIIDSQGRTYYEFPEAMALPLERFLKQKEFMEWMSSGLSNENLTMLVENAQVYLTEALGKKAGSTAFATSSAKVAAILSQIGERQDRIVDLDLVINCLCALVVREDEDPLTWNQSIHQEKCNYFKDHHTDYQFFFRFTAFRELAKRLNVSQENWIQYLAEMRTKAQILRQSMKIYSSGPKSSKAESKT